MSFTEPMSFTALGEHELVGWVAQASDDEIAAALAHDRDGALDEIFRRMTDHYDPGSSRDLTAVVEFQITDRPEGGVDRFQARIGGGAVAIQRGGEDKPRTTLTMRPVDFVKVITAQVTPQKLFMLRRIKVKGDLMLAARLAGGVFRLPEVNAG